MTIHVEYLGGPAHGTARAFTYLDAPLPRLYVRRVTDISGTVYRLLGHVPGVGGRWQYVMVPDARVVAAPPPGIVLLAAVAALAHALDVVRLAPAAPGLLAALDQAESAVAALGDDPTTRVLARLIGALHRCRSTNVPTSSALDATFRALSLALHVDGRWGPSGVLGGAGGG